MSLIFGVCSFFLNVSFLSSGKLHGTPRPLLVVIVAPSFDLYVSLGISCSRVTGIGYRNKALLRKRKIGASNNGPLVEFGFKPPYLTFTVKYGLLGVFGMNFPQMPQDANVR